MKKILLSLLISCTSLTLFAQTSADYNYTIGLRGYTMMQLPKILNETNMQQYTNAAFNGIMLKFNNNQASLRLNGNYYRGDKEFDNTCATCEIGKGTVTDYSFKIGFEKNISYSKIQPYFGFDMGYRSNRFTGTLTPKTATTGITDQTVDASKNGLVLTPFFGLKVNILPQLNVFAESAMDFYYSYEKQDIAQPNGAARTVSTYRKWEFLLNPISAGLQFNLNSKN